MKTEKTGIYWIGSYSTQEQVFSPLLKKVLNIFSSYACNKILDVGCGDGGFTKKWEEVSKAKEAYGIEISNEACELAMKKGIKAICMDLQGADLPFESSYFDAIFCGDVLGYLFDPDHLLEELFRVLKQGGICVMTIGNMASWHNRIALLLGYEIYGRQVSTRYDVGKLLLKDVTKGSAPHQIRTYTLRGLEELVIIYRFTIIKAFGAPKNYQFRIPFPFNIIDRVFSVIPSLSPMIILVLGK